ncbi:MAG: SpoIIE family protein phosphatase [Clostridia bacterium]|nr:SpoIIE family protein phosphatase [Clostridia bacterium]
MSLPISKERNLKDGLRKGGSLLVWQFTAFLCGFFTARSHVLGALSPLGIAFATGVSSEYTLTAAAGALFGYLLPNGSADNIRYMGATALASFTVWVLHNHIKNEYKALFSALCSGGSLLGVMLALFFAGEATISLPSIVGESLLAAGGAYFFACFSATLQRGNKILTIHQITTGAISVTLLLASLMELSLFELSPARIIGVTIILFAARYGKEQLASIAGIAVGFSVFLANPDYTAAALGLVLGGLIGGIFSPVGKFGVCVGFVVANGLVAIVGFDRTMLPLLYECFISALIFMVSPTKINQFFSRIFSPPPEQTLVEGLRNNMVMRLSFAAEAVQDVSQTVEEVAGKLKRINAPTFENVFQQTEQIACQSCSMRIFCWESNRGETLSALLSATKKLRTCSTVSTDDLPDGFFRICVRPDRVLDALAEQFADYLAKDSAQRRLDEIRTVIAEQFQGVADMLTGLSEEFRHSQRYDQATADSIYTVFHTFELTPTDVSCRIDRFDRMTAEIRLDSTDGGKVSRAALLRALEQQCSRTFEVPTLTELGESLLITLSEKAEFSVDFGVAQFKHNQNKLCGDAYHQFYDGHGRFIMLVSDGMGKGGRAAVDGAMASGLMARLFKAGFEPDSALKIVNSAMLYKSTDESLATVDLTVIDLFGGHTEFYKAGAPATLLCKNGNTGIANGENLPAGIFQGVAFDRANVTLSKGDIVVMMSDGATTDGTDWIGVELETWKRGTAQALAEHLADYARRRCPSGQEDDITVAVAILEKGY